MWLSDISRYHPSPFLGAVTKHMTNENLLDSNWRTLEFKTEMLLSGYDFCSSTSWGEEGVVKVSWNCDPQVEVSVLLTLKTYVAWHAE
jgi:hypothetical protein